MVSVCLPSDALLQHLPSYLGVGYLLPWAWGISSRLLQQSAAAAPYLDEGNLLTAALPDLQHEMAPLGPPAPAQPPLLERGVALPGRRPWPQTWGGSSWPIAPTLGVGWLLPAAAPDLGCP